MIRYETVTGSKVPRAARRLARRDGVMREWYDGRRNKMFATLVYRGDKLIGWCAATRVYFLWWPTDTFEIGTYVQRSMRGNGYAKKLLNRTLQTLKIVEPKGKVRYGTPDDHGYFNNVYEKTLDANGLRPIRYWCV